VPHSKLCLLVLLTSAANERQLVMLLPFLGSDILLLWVMFPKFLDNFLLRDEGTKVQANDCPDLCFQLVCRNLSYDGFVTTYLETSVEQHTRRRQHEDVVD